MYIERQNFADKEKSFVMERYPSSEFSRVGDNLLFTFKIEKHKRLVMEGIILQFN